MIKLASLLKEVQYPTDLKVGSVILGQGFTMLKGIDGGKYYVVVDMDSNSATLSLSDKNGNKKGSSKVRHKLDSIEGGIKTAKRGDENGIVVVKESAWKIKSDYETYHKSYTSAINAAREYAEKQGYEINDDDSFTKIGMGPRKPSEGKTNRFSIELSKDGKLSRRQLHIQVYGMKNGYELNAYIQ